MDVVLGEVVEESSGSGAAAAVEGHGEPQAHLEELELEEAAARRADDTKEPPA